MDHVLWVQVNPPSKPTVMAPANGPKPKKKATPQSPFFRSYLNLWDCNFYCRQNLGPLLKVQLFARHI